MPNIYLADDIVTNFPSSNQFLNLFYRKKEKAALNVSVLLDGKASVVRRAACHAGIYPVRTVGLARTPLLDSCAYATRDMEVETAASNFVQEAIASAQQASRDQIVISI